MCVCVSEKPGSDLEMALRTLKIWMQDAQLSSRGTSTVQVA